MASGVAAALALSLGACGTGGPGNADVTLKVVVADYGADAADTTAYWQGLVAAFEKQYPDIAVELDPVPHTRLTEAVADRVAAGDAPDIAQTGAFASYARSERLYSADDLLSIATQADFVPALARAGEISHVQYGLPFRASTPRLFYNKKLFKKAGLDGPPTSWDELAADAAALEEAGVRTPYALQLGPEAAEDEALSWLLGNNGGYVGLGGSWILDSPQNTTALRALRDRLVAPGLTGPEGAGLNRSEAYRAFVGGKAGMLLAHPALMARADRAHLRYATAPFPRRQGGAATPTGSTDWLVAFQQRGHVREAGAFLDFLYSTPNVTRYAEHQGTLPVTVPAAEAMRADGHHRALWPFVDQLRDAQFPQLDTVGGPQVTAALQKRIARAVSKGGDPAAVLSAIQHKADSEMSQVS
ncbi:extracellular solute-binding protein [Streptomyces sp. NPDC042319]|uniref:extracellular solute-binding protein n=1 Tax=Streptomyces sp. NPDC042319 TaxID=3154332 RepID=UPI0033DC6E3B